MSKRELLQDCLRAFVALSSATASTNRLMLMGLQRQREMTPQEDLADQMAKILHAALGEEK